MKCHFPRAASAALAVGAALTCLTASRSSSADTTVVEPAPAPVAESRSHYVPNAPLIGSGLVVFGLSYVPAVVVAGESSQSADHHLYVPVVGPWLDLGDRPACGVGSISCDNETTNKVLIAADGVFQGLGVIAVVTGLLMPEHEHVVATTAEVEKPSVHVTPAQLGSGGYGLAAFGKF